MGTERRSPGEKSLAGEILDKARKAPAGSKEKFARAKKYADAAEKSERHEQHLGKSSIDGLPIKYFYDIGDSVTGVLGECQSEAHIASSYPIVLDSGRIIRVPGNRRLRLAIEKADALFQRVTIEYRGKLYKKGGHYEKVYRLELAPLGKEGERR